MRMEQRLLPRTDLRQLQRQILSPRIIQSIQVLQLATPELDRLVQQELSENPALELADGDTSGENPAEAPPIDTHGEVSEAEGDRIERDLEFLERYNEDYAEQRTQRGNASRLEGEDDAKIEALNNAPAPGGSLQDHLTRQLAVLDLDQCILDAALLIIQALDSDGLLTVPLESVIGDKFGEGSKDVGEEALKVVQTLDPPGVGARGPQEALLLQIDPNDQDYELYRKVLAEHWDDLLKNKLPKIAKETGYEIDDIKFAIEQISTLTPYPGREFSSSSAQVVTPDLVIEEDTDAAGGYHVRMINDYLPRLSVNNEYRKLLEQAKDKETVDYLKIKVENARALIEAVQQRQSTLKRVGDSILQHQHDFMEMGTPGLKPLKMQDVADELKVHVSTICRAVADKYVETPRGIYPLKYFFVGGTETLDGEDTSRHAVKDELHKIVDGEDKSSPLSDDAIGHMLTAKLGVKIARRTVAKYRDQMNIPDSRQRKAY
ncbi:MAG: RNA polymerase factor sigma-54 [Planctomycetes bacterium]|nr:RNA polymerase factor sigma-54 [Planctomycetota bacterium]NUQ34489.1 RNA polymerase factor sigma-54 [Planctomycetaceae bacterium]